MRKRPDVWKRPEGEHRARSRRPWKRAAGAALGLALCLGTATVSVASDPGTDPGNPTAPPSAASTDQAQPATSDAKWTSRDAAAYWTPQRMAAAAPPPNADGQSTGALARSAPTSPSAAARLPATARHFEGIPTVGVLFSVDGDTRAHHCTASVVRSPHRNLILTAGHCEPGENAAFVPQYQSGAQTQPYGVWAIGQTFSYPGRGTKGSASDLDFAFATVEPDADGRSIEDVTGGNVLTRTPGYNNKVTVTGYPSVRKDPQDRAVRCDTNTTRLAGTRQLRMECGGFYGGTSGSPWLTGFDEGTKTGRIIGLIGGLNGGGPKGPQSDRISYSPYFGTEIFALYAAASKA